MSATQQGAGEAGAGSRTFPVEARASAADWARRGFVTALIAGALGLGLFPPESLGPERARALGAILVTLGFWATGAIPGYLASLIFIATVIVLGVATPAEAFAGFASPAMWLIVSGFVIGAAIRSTGLGDRLANALDGRLTASYPALLGGLMLVCLALTFVMPSSVGRLVVMMPVGLALAERCGFPRGSMGRRGTVLAVAFGTHLPGFAVLPSNIPNVVMAGGAQTLFGVEIGYADYLILHFPILGLLKAGVIVALILRFFPDAPRPGTQAMEAPDPHDGLGRRRLALAAILAVTLALWMTDDLHGVAPAWVAISAACVLLVPAFGFVSPAEFSRSADFGTLLFVAGLLALGTVANATGLGAELAGALERLLPLGPDRPAANFASLGFMSFATALLTTLPGAPAVMTPIARDLANATGLSLETVLMSQVLGFSTILFAYQSGPLLVAMRLAGEPISILLKLLLPLTLITVVVLMPLDFLWWRLLGWI